MKNDQIPPNPHPVKPPSDLPLPRKESLQAENARLKAEVETIRKDKDLLLASHKVALADIQRLQWELQTVKEGKNT